MKFRMWKYKGIEIIRRQEHKTKNLITMSIKMLTNNRNNANQKTQEYETLTIFF